MRSSLRIAMIGCLLLIAHGSTSAANIIGFKEAACFTQLGLAPRDPETRCVGPEGIGYSFRRIFGRAELHGISIAVHVNIDLCREMLRNTKEFEIGFRAAHCSFPFADEAYFYGFADTGGTFRFRRANLSVQVLFTGPMEDMLPKLQELDGIIQNNGEIAVRGAFAETPRIETLPVARPLDREPLEVRPTVTGLGESARLLITMDKVRGEGEPVILGAANHWGLRAVKYDDLAAVPLTIVRPDGTRDTRMKRVEVSPRGRAIIRVMVANPDHVFVTRDFEVPVAN